jgi:hypothetical protein
MARDLIPPPSPAGRPPADGTPTFVELPPEPPQPGAAAAETTVSGPSQFRNRFGFLVGALAGVLIAAVAVVVIVIVDNHSSNDGAGLAKNWSTWKPQDSNMSDGPAEIATHVGDEYRLDNGSQLDSVTGGDLEFQGFKLNVALRPATGNIQLLDSGHAVLYTLNGLGPGGSILGGTASTARHQLVRREALELALYTFRYIKNVDMVVTLLPPPPAGTAAAASGSGSGSGSGAAASASGAASGSASGSSGADPTEPPVEAVFYRPGDLKQELQVPLDATLAAKAPTPSTIGGGEGQRIDALTLSNLFDSSFQQAQNGDAYLVLDRPTG